MFVIGLDIGTTSICAAVIDADSGEVCEVITRQNSFSVVGRGYERMQSPDEILNNCLEMINALISRFDVCAIGVTGQMHGILYLDRDGNAVSNLYTWQDMSGNESFGGKSYAEFLSELTGYKVATGFGLTTYFVHSKKGEVPKSTEAICTIHDYAAMKLCSLPRPIMHTSDAASLGLFDIGVMAFDMNAVKKAGLNPDFLPRVTDSFEIIGEYRGIPVCVAIGDNQASFIGSVSDMDMFVLVNIGTGSQISFLTNDTSFVQGTETRPCGGSLLRVGSALCGGSAFAALESFIRKTALIAGADIDSAYPYIDAFLASGTAPPNPLAVSTRFSGTRDNPAQRGKIEGISLDNFTPEHLIYGVLNGIAAELLEMYSACNQSGHTRLVGSGNGLRKNPALQKIFAEAFGMPLMIPLYKEEAAYGAALSAVTACGKYDSLELAQKLIKYQ